MLMKFKKVKQEIVGTEFIDSLKISDNFYSKQENRIKTLLLKGLIVYLITAGSVGGTITATGTSFNHVIFNSIIALLSVIISLIYYNKKTENIGDILYLFGIIFFGIFLGAYINSGFYGWMNDVIGAAGAYFNMPDVGGFNQIIKNNELTVTIAACYLGAVIVILVNMSIAKKMIYMDLFLDSLIILFLPLYFGLEPNYVYFIMLITGFVYACIWRSTGRYVKVNNNSVYIRTKNDITYTYNFKAHILSFVQIFISILVILCTLYIVIPKDLYNLYRSRSDAKEYTDDFVQTFITSGIAGFFNRYENIAGLSSGRLGGVNSVSLDYETDLKITFVPSNFEPIYLRTFIGGNYEPYSNRWNVATPTYLNRNEYRLLSEEYNSKKNRYSSKGKMLIENIDGENGEYSLYYSDKDTSIKTNTIAERVYYTRINGMQFSSSSQSLSNDEKAYWLSVPNDNVPSIINTINKINIPEDATSLEIVQLVKDYYFDNVPYTLRPGSTPFRKDFINYFLDVNKKGYCVHFASAATLMFRYMGIPARYVEGYVYDYSEASNTTINEDLLYSDFYSGYNPLGEVPVLSAEISDACGHAWIEIYEEGFGWIPVDVTPPSSDNEIVSEGFFTRLFNRLSSNSDISDLSETDNATLSIDSKIVRKVLLCILYLIVLISLSYYIIKTIKYYHTYSRSDINTKLIMRYRRFICAKAKKNTELLNKYNYRDQLAIIYDINEEQKLLSIIEKAGFSNTLISQEDFDYCISTFKNCKK